MSHPLDTTPTKVVAVHLNYASRAAQRGKAPEYPSYFLKSPSSVSGSGDPLVRPRGCELVGFEGEVALVIGERARNVTPEQGWAHVRWVTAANDAGVYDLKYADKGSNFRSKSGDGFTPIGPRLLDARAIDPGALRVRTWLNDELVQDDTTDTLIFTFGHLVADISRTITLEPGDVILTGTPAGAAVAQVGDTVSVEVNAGEASTGRLANQVIEGDPLAAYGAMPVSDDSTRMSAYGEATAPRTPLSADLVAMLNSVGTATLSSQMRKRGLNNMSIDGIHAGHPDKRMVGLAHTLRFVPSREDLFAKYGGGINAQKRAVESLKPGDVLVIEARQDPYAGTYGDIMALRSKVLGASGIVSDGGVRDLAAVTAVDLPFYYSGEHPAVLGRRHVPWETDRAIACGGTVVQPGEILVGDADGVVVLPPDIAAEVAAAAIEQELQEVFIAEEVAAGASMRGLYPIGPDWQPKYEQWRAARESNRS